jgi:hypothetical protein
MRKRKSYPNISPTPSDRFSITEKGLRACGATNMEKAVEQLRKVADELEKGAGRLNQEMPTPEAAPRRRRKSKGPKMLRRGTVCGRYRYGSEVRVSDLRLCGLWLKAAGFDIGQKYEVEVEDDKLTIRPKERDPERPPRAGDGESRKD